MDTSNTEVTEGNPAFRSVFTDSSGGMLTATLTSLSEAYTVEGTMVLCDGESSREGPLTITVAGEFFVCQTMDQYTHAQIHPPLYSTQEYHSL